MAQIVLGDMAAFAQLYRGTAKRVFRQVRNILRSKEDADEVACDVYVYVWQYATAFDSSRGGVIAWLTVIANARAVGRLRKSYSQCSAAHKANDVEALACTNPTPDMVVTRWQEQRLLRGRLASLNPLRRRLLDLSFFQGLSHREIAQTVQWPLGSIKSHVRRALRTLEASLPTRER